MTAIDFYKDHLNIYAHKNLPRFYQCKKFHERIDSLLLLMVRQCPFIHTLVCFWYFYFEFKINPNYFEGLK